MDREPQVGDWIEPVPVLVQGRPVTNPAALRVEVPAAGLERARRLVREGRWRVVERGGDEGDRAG